MNKIYIVSIVDKYKFHTENKEESINQAKKLSEELKSKNDYYSTVYVDEISKKDFRQYLKLNYDNEFLTNNSNNIDEF